MSMVEATEVVPREICNAASLDRRARRLTDGFVIALHGIAPARFSEFMNVLRPHRVIPLSELVGRGAKGQSTAGLFSITVDDGVGENVRGLTKLCQAHGWPATFYLPTQYLDSGEPMAFQYWWIIKPRLPRMILELPSGPVDLSVAASRKNFCDRMERSWYVGRAETYLPLTMELAGLLTSENDARALAPIGWSEVEQLSRDPLFQFESHGVSHVAMSALTEEEIAAEMALSQKAIEEHTNRPCRHLCYPFGSPESIGTLAPELARRYYDSAATMRLGSADHSDLWRLRRIPLYPENSLPGAWMKVWLSCSKWGRRCARLPGLTR